VNGGVQFRSMPRGWGAGRTVRTKRWRLIERLDGSRELYDHSTDPAEYHNLIDDPERSEFAADGGAFRATCGGSGFPVPTSGHRPVACRAGVQPVRGGFPGPG
jgi:hypothetical protein